DSLNNAIPTSTRMMPRIRWTHPHWVRSNVTSRFGPATTNWSSAIATRPWMTLNAPAMIIIVPAKTIQPYQPLDVGESMFRWGCAMSVLLVVSMGCHWLEHDHTYHQRDRGILTRPG